MHTLRNLRTASAVLLMLASCRMPPGSTEDVLRGAQLRTHPATGEWTGGEGMFAIDTRTYDDLLSFGRFIDASAPWSFEVELKGRRAGIYFSLDDTLSKRTSHMVRFEDRSILAGYFNGGGEYTATSTFLSPSNPSEWTRLRVDVDPSRKRYTVVVNGTPVGTDSTLKYPSGFAGLQASDGLSKFRSIRLTGRDWSAKPEPPRMRSIFRMAHVRNVETHGAEVCVHDPISGLWLTLDGNARILRTHAGPATPPRTTASAVIAGNAVELRNEDGSVRTVLRDRLGSPYAVAERSGDIFVTDRRVNAVVRFSTAGNWIQTIDAGLLGGFLSPGGLALLHDGRLAVADYDRVVVIDPSDPAPMPVVRHGPSGTATVLTDGSPLSSFALAGDHHGATVRLTNDGSIGLENLRPLTSYAYRVGTKLMAIPESAGLSRELRFTTPPADPALRAYRELRLLYIVYREIDYRGTYPPEKFPSIPSGRRLTDDDIAYLRRAAAFNSEFFFRNSGGRLSLQFDIHVVDEPLLLSDVGDRDPYWLEPRERVTQDVERAAARFGRDARSYDGVLCTYAWVNHPPRRTSALRDPSVSAGDTVRIRQAYGGGTYGVPAPWRYGATAGYTGNPFQDRFSRQDWLITHEFHHHLDALMSAGGMPEYAHSDLPWMMPGRFGEDFDFNAAIIRRASPDDWLNMRFGTLRTFRDADRDGVPDDEPDLPFDERRLGSDPTMVDSDGDGLHDLDEVMAGAHRGSSLIDPDTDGDSVRDGADRLPLYAINGEVPRAGSAPATLARATLGGVETEIFAGWTPDSLTFEVRTSEPVNLLFQLDAANDGWFHGFDNVQLRVVRQGDSVYVADYYLRDCSSWVDAPKDRKDILSVDELRFRSLRIRIAALPSLSRDIVQFSIPARSEHGMAWFSGKSLALRIGVQKQADLWVWDELFDRNEMVSVRLR